MKIAVIGSGISGLTATWLLNPHHDVHLFEAQDRIGGHTHTVTVDDPQGPLPIDTGFIVFNRPNYPNFCRLLELLQVSHEKSDMSFSVKCEQTGLEYNGTSINSLFAQRRNFFKPAFYRMIRDILRFNRMAKARLPEMTADLSFGDFLKQGGFGQSFLENYILPMGAAIWSCEPRMVTAMPALFFIRFFDNHKMLNVEDRPQWRTIQNGSQSYVQAMIASFKNPIRLKTPVQGLTRGHDRVTLLSRSSEEHFDRVIIATHSDEALKLLSQPSDLEKRVLSAIPYQANEAVLHWDESLLPKKRLARASWNVHRTHKQKNSVAITYYMNILQNLKTARHYCVTLNYTEAIDPQKIIRKMKVHHPVFGPDSLWAQEQHHNLMGARASYFCGAYWGFGFHEDGVNSALRVCKHLGVGLP